MCKTQGISGNKIPALIIPQCSDHTPITNYQGKESDHWQCVNGGGRHEPMPAVFACSCPESAGSSHYHERSDTPCLLKNFAIPTRLARRFCCRCSLAMVGALYSQK